MMDLIDEEDRFLPGSAQTIGRRSDHATHFGHVAFDAAQAHEFCVRYLGNNVRERGFSGAWGAGKNYRRQTIGFNRSAQKFSRPENMFLADELLERTWAHPGGERRPSICARKIDIFLFVEKVVHDRKYDAPTISASDFGLGAGLIYSRQPGG